MRRALPLLLLTGCVVGPDYAPPATATPAAWTRAEGEKIDAGTADVSRWWAVFRDPLLEALVARAVEGSPDLRIAAARVREARAAAGVARGALLPEIAAGGSYERRKTSGNVFTFPGADLHQSRYAAGFDAAWEIDLFGGLRRDVEAAGADAQAAEEDARAVLVTLRAETARVYVELRGAQRRRAVLRAQAASAADRLALLKSRLAAGVATALDVAREEALLHATESGVPPAEADVARAVHRLGVLLGRDPGALVAELAADGPIPVPPARIVVGLPAALLARRPDVRRAERELAAATARIGVATAEFYPKISLTGAFGLESLRASDLFETGSRAWSLGPAVRWPIFTAGRLRAGVDAAEARQARALAAFEGAVLAALEEVENALVGYLREGDRRRSLERALEAGRRALALSEDLHRQGLANFLDVLTAQRSVQLDELALASSDAALTLFCVALYKALGGGWEPASP
ncbi:MAG TPA: efflux transporter outer membrane subunit [Planctomycetota bacterium]